MEKEYSILGIDPSTPMSLLHICCGNCGNTLSISGECFEIVEVTNFVVVCKKCGTNQSINPPTKSGNNTQLQQYAMLLDNLLFRMELLSEKYKFNLEDYNEYTNAKQHTC